MKNRFTIVISVFLLACGLFFSGKSQGTHLESNFTISWNPLQVYSNPGSSATSIMSFQGSVLKQEFGLLPVFLKLFPLATENDSVVNVLISNQVFVQVPAADLLNVQGLDNIPAAIDPVSLVTLQKKKPSLELSLLPLRRNPSTGLVERLTSFSVSYDLVRGKVPHALKSTVSYAPNSILASGTWVKFAVGSDGIYQISYEDLKKAGVDVASVDPRNLRIYGNGGGMLPEANSAKRTDDLRENSIYVFGEEDGRFDPGDYLVFYGQSPDRWVYNRLDHLYHHRKNVYSDRMYYFLNFDLGPGKRVGSETSTTQPSTYVTDRFDDYAFYEKDNFNMIKSGREWWDGQTFDITTVRNYSFSFANIDELAPVTLKTDVAARSTVGSSSFTISAQGNVVLSLSVPSTSGGFESDYAVERSGTATFLTSNPVVDISLNYRKNSSSIGYLNYLEVNAKRHLTMNGAQMMFRSGASASPGTVTEFTMNGNGQNVQIWDVSEGGDIRAIQASKAGNSYIFRLPTDTLREFLAFDGSSFAIPEFVGRVENQNLHGAAVPDYLIVCHPDFLGEAERLANFHRQNSHFSVMIATPEKIYNEFSSGAQDVTAIRDFVKMLYDKSAPGGGIRYLLLFGDASYDYKNRIQNNTNFVPAYESESSLSPISSFVSDDYFGLLNPNEGQGASGTLNIGVGRLPVDTPDQAKASVEKVIHYCSPDDAVKNDWRNVVTFVSDDRNKDEGNLFIEYSEELAKGVDDTYKNYNIDKIYSDAYTIVSTPGGARYPEVNDAITKRVEKGSLIMNYIGHGGEVGWAHERILEVPDIKNWNNFNNMPVFVTATCEFSRFDDPERVSAGEWVFLNPRGGGVALFTTSRLTYAGPNQTLLVNFFNSVFKKTDGAYARLGDLLVAAKKGMSSAPNIHAFVLLGDPAMQMAYPNLNVATTSINQNTSMAVPDTLKALAEVTITGEVQNASGQRAVDFSGTLFPTVFDKSSEIWTKANQGSAPPVQFFLRKNPVYKGKVYVINGSFSFSFIVPKDIAYKYGVGKISYYARSPETDANGYDEGVQVGGFNYQAPVDDQGPEISLYINNRHFRSGGITDQNPVLLADVSDTSGVNTVGNGIGHDITAVLDGKTTVPMILNDYYVSDLNTFKSGVINYPLSSLSDGPHQITVKVWDVYNNSSDAMLDFIVTSSAEFALQHLMNYPNPMRDQTTFSWETNQVDQPAEVEIRIYTLTGNLIKTIKQTIYSQGYRAASIEWDGTQDDGRKISSGMYVYQLQLMIPDGTAKRLSSKLVVIR